MNFHKSVLSKEVLKFLDVKQNRWYLDATLGDGGHALAILQVGGNVVGIDVDPEALERARKRLQGTGFSGQNFNLIQGNFRDLKNLVNPDLIGVNRKFSGILFDLGVSSLQFDEAKRGFSFMRDASLDMRMDPHLSVTAADLINGLNSGELSELFTKLGEEKFAQKIANEIILQREKNKITTTLQLAHLIEKVVGKHGKINPATKVFQALRIAVNDELNCLKEALPQALELLDNKGIMIVISFHSLEDRIVKHFFKSKNLITPSPEEISINPRSRSAKMRVYEKKE